jgi:lipopolysaccharide export system permease protein
MIFRRSLLREFSSNATYVFVVLVAILLTQFAVKLIGAASTGSLPVDGLLPLIGLRLLSQLPMLLVIAMFLSILLTLSRSWRDSEMAIWMSSGQSLVSWIRPVLTFAVPLLLVAAVLSIGLSPWAEKRTAEYRRILDARDDLSMLAPGLFQEMRRNKQVFFVETSDLIRGVIKNVFVFSDSATDPSITRAEQGFIITDDRGDRYIILENGRRVRRTGATAQTSEFEFAEFERYGVRMSSNEISDGPLEERATDTLTLIEKATPSAFAWVFYRLSIPLSGLLLAILAIPMAYVNPRVGRSGNLIMAILLLMSTLQLINIMQSQISAERISFILAMVLFHAALAFVVFIVFYRRAQGIAFRWPWQRGLAS